MAVAALRRVSSSRLVFALVVVVAGLAVVVVVECPGSQRVAAFFAEAMSARVVSSCLGLYTPLSSGNPAAVAARQVLNGISPFVAFEHFSANQAIQEAFEREVRMHIIDLDIMQGLQWPGLFHNLASRLGGPHRIKRTGLGAF